MNHDILISDMILCILVLVCLDLECASETYRLSKTMLCDRCPGIFDNALNPPLDSWDILRCQVSIIHCNINHYRFCDLGKTN